MKSYARTVGSMVVVAALSLAGSAIAIAADPEPFACAGITEIPGGATLAADRNGNEILITASGAVIRCDGMGAFDGLSAGGFGFGVVAGVQTFPGSTFVSSFVEPRGSTASWSLVQALDFPKTNQFLTGYLGANADGTMIFWRSTTGGPIETWVSDGAGLTP